MILGIHDDPCLMSLHVDSIFSFNHNFIFRALPGALPRSGTNEGVSGFKSDNMNELSCRTLREQGTIKYDESDLHLFQPKYSQFEDFYCSKALKIYIIKQVA